MCRRAVTLNVQNIGGSGGGDEIGCVQIDVPTSFSISSVSIVSIKGQTSGHGWQASTSSIGGAVRVTFQNPSDNNVLVGLPVADRAVFRVTGTPTSAGLITWIGRAYDKAGIEWRHGLRLRYLPDAFDSADGRASRPPDPQPHADATPAPTPARRRRPDADAHADVDPDTDTCAVPARRDRHRPHRSTPTSTPITAAAAAGRHAAAATRPDADSAARPSSAHPPADHRRRPARPASRQPSIAPTPEASDDPGTVGVGRSGPRWRGGSAGGAAEVRRRRFGWTVPVDPAAALAAGRTPTVRVFSVGGDGPDPEVPLIGAEFAGFDGIRLGRPGADADGAGPAADARRARPADGRGDLAAGRPALARRLRPRPASTTTPTG